MVFMINLYCCLCIFINGYQNGASYSCMKLRIQLEGWSSFPKLPWIRTSFKLGLALVSHKTLTDNFTSREDCPKDPYLLNHHKKDPIKSLGSDNLVKYGCDSLT